MTVGCKWCGGELSVIGDCNVWVCRNCDRLPLPPLRRAHPDPDGDHA